MRYKNSNLDKPKKQFWAEHLERWKTSGLTQKKYCQQSKISYPAFGYWRTHLSKIDQSKSTESAIPLPVFKPAKISPSLKDGLPLMTNLIKITLPNQTKIEIPSSLSQAELISIFQALGV